jgi:dUTPase
VNAPGPYSLSVTGTGLAGADTNTFIVTGAKATQLVVALPPPSTVTAASGFEVDVLAEDANGNVDPTFNGSVAIALASNPGGAALGGTQALNAVNGMVAFTGLAVNQTGTGFTLRAFASGLTAAITAGFDVTPAGTAAQLVVTTAPPATMTAGDSFGFTVTAEDSTGVVDTSFNGTVAVAVNNGASLGGVLTATAHNGVAGFTGLTLDAAGAFQLSATSGALVPATAAITVNAATATQLFVTTNSNVLANAPFSVSVLALDGNNNLDLNFNGSVTIALHDNPASANLGGTKTVTAVNGIASFTDLTLDQPGSGETLQAASTGLTPGTSAAFEVDSEQLVVTAQPPGVVLAGHSFGVTVSIEDSTGHVDTSFQGSVMLTLANLDDPTATLGGTATMTASNGVAAFTGLTLSVPGSCVLVATSTGLVSGSTQSFQVTGTAAAHNALIHGAAQPASATSGNFNVAGLDIGRVFEGLD